VDRLASDAAETERQRIARNLHDSVSSRALGSDWGWRRSCRNSTRPTPTHGNC
jgi:hypothetical protein